MPIKRKSHNLDEQLLDRAKRVLGVDRETDAIRGALRSILIGEQALADLASVKSRRPFRADFERQMRREMRKR